MLHDLAGHLADLEDRLIEFHSGVRDGLDEGGFDPDRMDDAVGSPLEISFSHWCFCVHIIPRSHFLGAMPQPDLLRQSFMERQRTGFRAGVIHHFAAGYEAGRAGHGDDVPVVPLQHARHELLDGPEVSHRVDLEDLADRGLRFLDDEALGADAGVVDQHRRVPVCLAHLRGRRFDAL